MQRCVDEIRLRIFNGEYLPGVSLRQAELAAWLGTSRIPVREALTVLENEGVVRYTPHVGHSVTRLDASQLAQIYTLRRLIEAELLDSIDLEEVDVTELEEIQNELEVAVRDLAVDEVIRLNLQFHFRLYEYSPHTLMLTELRRLWNMTGFYRAMQIHNPQHRDKIIEEHLRILDAIRSRDKHELTAATDAHRSWRDRRDMYPLAPYVNIR